VGCTFVNVVVSVSISGGVTAAAITNQSVGVFLRLGFACLLNAPLQNVLIAAVSVPSSDALSPFPTTQSIAPDAAVNIAVEACSALRGSRLRRLDFREAQARTLTAGLPAVNVTLVVQSCVLLGTGADPASDATAALIARLAPFLNSTTSGVGGGEGAGDASSWTGPLATALGMFLGSAAATSGVDPSGVSVQVRVPVSRVSTHPASASLFVSFVLLCRAPGRCAPRYLPRLLLRQPAVSRRSLSSLWLLLAVARFFSLS
jgi:hypothetical protein